MRGNVNRPRMFTIGKSTTGTPRPLVNLPTAWAELLRGKFYIPEITDDGILLRVVPDDHNPNPIPTPKWDK